MNPNRKPKRKRINPYDSEALGSGFANAVHKAERNATPDQRLAAIEAVLELHSKDSEGGCRECCRIAAEDRWIGWPCTTVWAIREALE